MFRYRMMHLRRIPKLIYLANCYSSLKFKLNFVYYMYNIVFFIHKNYPSTHKILGNMEKNFYNMYKILYCLSFVLLFNKFEIE